MNHTKLKKDAKDYAKGVAAFALAPRSDRTHDEVEHFVEQSVRVMLEKWYKLGYKDAEADRPKKGGK